MKVVPLNFPSPTGCCNFLRLQLFRAPRFPDGDGGRGHADFNAKNIFFTNGLHHGAEVLPRHRAEDGPDIDRRNFFRRPTARVNGRLPLRRHQPRTRPGRHRFESTSSRRAVPLDQNPDDDRHGTVHWLGRVDFDEHRGGMLRRDGAGFFFRVCHFAKTQPWVTAVTLISRRFDNVNVHRSRRICRLRHHPLEGR